MDDQQREERDPQALQQELMEIELQMSKLAPQLEKSCENFNIARTPYEVDKLKMKLLKDRRSVLQSVLKSLL